MSGRSTFRWSPSDLSVPEPGLVLGITDRDCRRLRRSIARLRHPSPWAPALTAGLVGFSASTGVTLLAWWFGSKALLRERDPAYELVALTLLLVGIGTLAVGIAVWIVNGRAERILRTETDSVLRDYDEVFPLERAE